MTSDQRPPAADNTDDKTACPPEQAEATSPDTEEKASVPATSLSFGQVAAAYHAGRPSYPPDALRWILGTNPLTVLDLGAGTGKLSARAVALGHHVIAVDPSEQMLGYARELDGVEVMTGSAEAIPLGPASVDAVVVAQAFHSFEHDRALPEIARVLRPNGVLGLLWNSYDTVVPWVRRFHAAVQAGQGNEPFDPMPVLIRSELLSVVERATFRQWHELDRTGLCQLAQSVSRVAMMPEDERIGVLDRVVEIYLSSARPPEPVRLPYLTRCYRTRLKAA